MNEPCQLSAVLITLDEENKIEECLKSVNFADEIVIVDSGSKDRTVEMAEALGAKLYHRDFDTFANQKNYAIDKARGQWVLLIDADERISEGLRKEILSFMKNPGEITACWFKRSNFMFGRNVRFGANKGDRQLRLIKAGSGKFEGLVHERITFEGPDMIFDYPLMHETYQTKEEYFQKFELYIRLEVEQIQRQGRKIMIWDWLLRPPFQFFYFYFLKLGFLDGRVGLQFHLYSAFYTFTKYFRASKRRG